MNKKILLFFSFLAFVLVISLFSAKIISAQTQLVPEPSEPNCPSSYTGGGNCGNYSLNDIVKTFFNVSQIILGIVGALALLMFVYGGFLMLISGETTITEGDKTSKINKGKKALTNAIMGLIIVFASYTIIQFVMDILGIEKAGGGGWSQIGWF